MDPLSLAVVSVLFLLVSISCYSWIFKNSRKQLASLPPGPRGLPIVGFLPFLRDDLHHQFTELAAQYGPIYKLWLGNKLCIVIDSASLAKEIVRDNDTIFANRHVTIAARIGSYGVNDIAWSPYGTQWRNLRKIFASDMLSNANLKASCNLRKDVMKKVVKEIFSKIGTPICISELTLQINLSTLVNLIWGSKVQEERRDMILSGLLPMIEEISDLLVKPNISDFIPVLSGFDIQGIAKQMTTLMQRFEALTADTIDQRMKNLSESSTAIDHTEGRKDFLQILVELMQDENNKASLGQAQLKALLLNILVGGSDTTATTIEWVMAELMSHPKVMKKLQQELSEVVGFNNILEESHLPKLEYMEAVINETMRLHPIGAFLLPRTPSQSCTVGGYIIPKDSVVYVNARSIQRNPLAWDNPLEFRPERFLDNNEKFDYFGNNLNYMPFGSGRRICVGLSLAERMVGYILASLLHSFEWRLPEEEKLHMSDKLYLVLRKRIPLRVVPDRKSSCSGLYE